MYKFLLIFNLEVLVMNSILSLPYYLTVMLYEQEQNQIKDFFINNSTPSFILSLVFLLILASLS